MKYKYIILAILWLLAIRLAAQGTTAVTAASMSAPKALELNNIMFWVLLITCCTLVVVALFFMVKTNQFLSDKLIETEALRQGITLPKPVEVPQGEPLWTRLRKKYWEDAVPLEMEGTITMAHSYDGIRELDNRLPPWWVNMFLLCIVWSVGYMWYYHWGGDGPSSKQEYEMAMETAKKEKALALAGRADAVNEENVTLLADAGPLGEGEMIYKGSCAACHGQQGEGGVGPNMTDQHWLHGGGIKNVFKTVKYGVPEKGMIAWQTQLKPSDIQKVSSYIMAKLQGTTPPNPKAPQGEIWVETDSTVQKKVVTN